MKSYIVTINTRDGEYEYMEPCPTDRIVSEETIEAETTIGGQAGQEGY